MHERVIHVTYVHLIEPMISSIETVLLYGVIFIDVVYNKKKIAFIREVIYS